MSKWTSFCAPPDKEPIMEQFITQKIIDAAYRIDFLVKGRVIVEVKAVESISSIHLAQLLTYLRLVNIRKGLVLNFNIPTLKEGIRRVSNEFKQIPEMV